jgi:group I intron endonuclease
MIKSPSNCIYIGQSKNIMRRFGDHKRTLSPSQPRLYNSFVKHGVDNHTFEILELCSESELNNREKFYISLYGTFNTSHGLNLMDGGLLSQPSESSREKMSLARLGKKFKPHSEETKLKMSIARKGIVVSEETKEKIKKSKQSLPSNSKGIKWSEEQRIRASERMIGTIRGTYNKNVENRANKGIPLSQEHREKLSKAKLGKKLSKEHREKISSSNMGKESYWKGKTLTEEHKAKMSVSHLKRKKNASN